MAKVQIGSRNEDSTLQDLLPLLSNEAVEEMHYSKIKLASDKSKKSTRQMKDLERDIDILATEMKLRNMNMHVRTSSKEFKVESIAGRHKTTMNVEEKKKQRAKIAVAKKVAVSSRPTLKKPRCNSDSSVEEVTSNICSDAMPLSYKSVESNPLEDDNKKVSFHELVHMKKTKILKQQAMGSFYLPQQNVNKYYILKGKELDFEQVDYQMIKEKEDALVQEHLDLSRQKEKEHKLKLEPDEQNKSLMQNQTGSAVEENIYTLTVAFPEPPKVVESLYRPPSADQSNVIITEFATEVPTNIESQEILPLSDLHKSKRKLIGQGSKTDKAAKKSAKNDKDKGRKGLVQVKVVRKKKLALSKPKQD